MMSRWLLAAVLGVSGSGVIFGLDWRAEPPPDYLPATRVAVRSAPPPRAVVDTALSPARTAPAAKPAAPVVKTVMGAQPIPPASTFKPDPLPPPGAPAVAANSSPSVADASPPSAPVTDAAAPASDVAAAERMPKCDVQACEAAYFTFRAGDCTYQPSHGPRRLCAKGNPPQAALPDEARTAQASACNVEACQRAYFTFNPADCTYQPSYGPRRVCTK